MKERMPENAIESARERHERAAREVVERLRADGYFRQGEKAEFVRPDPGSDKKWVVRCDTDALLDAPHDPERKRRFQGDDPLYDAFVAAGFRVDVWPDYESASGETFRVEYHLYEIERQ